jgi:hypothetical protein
MTINAISAAIAKSDIANSDDPMAILQALQGLRHGIVSKVLSSAAAATAAEMQRAMAIRRFDELIPQLEGLRGTPDGKGKVLETFSGGSQQTANPTIDAQLAELKEELGLTLPREKWVYSYETATAPGEAADRVLTSPSDIAKIRKDYPLAKTEGGVSYYGKTTGTGKDEKTTYIAINANEGAQCVQNSAIKDLGSDLDALRDEATVLLGEQGMRLSGLSGELMRDVQQDNPFMKLAKDQQEHYDERHLDALMDPLHGTAPDSSRARKDDTT